jgi:methylphosphotriester-DNA--protein-cysteine methyltransferase
MKFRLSVSVALLLLVPILTIVLTQPGAFGTGNESTATLTKSITQAGVTPQVKTQVDPGTIVYVTKTGTKYHRAGCRYLAKSSIPMSLKDAVAKGYGPCSVCKPPTLDTSAPQATATPAPTPSTKSITAQSSDSGDVTVYVTRTGKKYHRAGCRELAKSSIPMSLKEAVAKGYTPCSICKPPIPTQK